MSYNEGKFEHLWKCTYCEKIYVIPDLARMCEAKHEELNA